MMGTGKGRGGNRGWKEEGSLGLLQSPPKTHPSLSCSQTTSQEVSPTELSSL